MMSTKDNIRRMFDAGAIKGASFAFADDVESDAFRQAIADTVSFPDWDAPEWPDVHYEMVSGVWVNDEQVADLAVMATTTIRGEAVTVTHALDDIHGTLLPDGKLLTEQDDHWIRTGIDGAKRKLLAKLRRIAEPE
jgi:hypothetical protein